MGTQKHLLTFIQGLVLVLLVLCVVVALLGRWVGSYFAVTPRVLRAVIASRGLTFAPRIIDSYRVEAGDLFVHFSKSSAFSHLHGLGNVAHSALGYGEWKGEQRLLHLTHWGVSMMRLRSLAVTEANNARVVFVRKLRCPDAARATLRAVMEASMLKVQDMTPKERESKRNEFRPAFLARGTLLGLGLGDAPSLGHTCTTSILYLLERAGILLPSDGDGEKAVYKHFWNPFSLLEMGDDAREMRKLDLRWAPGCSWDAVQVYDGEP